jgi:hypothetical protein
MKRRSEIASLTQKEIQHSICRKAAAGQGRLKPNSDNRRDARIEV